MAGILGKSNEERKKEENQRLEQVRQQEKLQKEEEAREQKKRNAFNKCSYGLNRMFDESQTGGRCLVVANPAVHTPSLFSGKNP